ncbi:MAG TPA: site-specific integrase [Pyrinomonadaceae bacterium]|jgi:integrase
MPRPRTGGAVFRENNETGKHYHKPKYGPRKGRKLRGDWWARVKYTDPETGRQKSVWRAADNKNDAVDKCRDLLNELSGEAESKKESPPGRKTFDDLADYYEARYLKAAQYVGGRKVAGQRSYKTGLAMMKALRGHFAGRPLRNITHGDVEDYKAHRLTVPTQHDLGRYGQAVRRYEKEKIKNPDAAPPALQATRALASAHRELSLLRRMMRVAEREGWIEKSPFRQGDALISLADERHRQRILTLEEEDLLLSKCADARAHLRPIVICALDTGMRRGEILKLRWEHVHLDRRAITITAFNTKTMRAREVPVSERLALELQSLYDKNQPAPDCLVFGIEDNIKRSFRTACRLAGLTGLRFHDLRHTAATRLVAHGLELPELGNLLGHTQAQTTYRYVNPTTDALSRAKDIFDQLKHKPLTQPTP